MQASHLAVNCKKGAALQGALDGRKDSLKIEAGHINCNDSGRGKRAVTTDPADVGFDPGQARFNLTTIPAAMSPASITECLIVPQEPEVESTTVLKTLIAAHGLIAGCTPAGASLSMILRLACLCEEALLTVDAVRVLEPSLECWCGLG